MINLTSEELAVIDLLLERDCTFVIYKLPNQDRLHFRMQTDGKVALLYDLKELNGKKGFVIAPFSISEVHPAVLMKPDVFSIPSYTQLSANLQKPTPKKGKSLMDTVLQEDFDAYRATFDLFLKELGSTALQKLVLSRKAALEKGITSFAMAFERACNQYPNSYTYLISTPTTGCWMGSTPEMLLRGDVEKWRTVALAGTQLVGEEPMVWDAKNREEQAIVSRYVERQLRLFGVSPQMEGPHNIEAGKMIHLVTDFSFEIPQNLTNGLGDLLSLLHPTPAVCGLPKEQAYRFILDNEGYNRSYYSGFIGEIASNGVTDIFVNLRCLKVERAGCTLYAGGGILSSSDLEKEWEETSNKMATMRGILG